MSNAKRVAHALGWFSLALGAVEIAAPKKVTDALGVRRRNGLVRTFGAREIAAGIGILTRNRKGPWMWGRVAGDALDLAALGAALKSRRRRAAVGVALASVAAITALDVIVGRKLSKRRVFAL